MYVFTEELECEEVNADVCGGVDQTAVLVAQSGRTVGDLRVFYNLDVE